MTRRTLTDAERIASIREALTAAQGDWAALMGLWSIHADLTWLLERVELTPSPSEPSPAEGRYTTFWRAEDEAILDRMWGRPHTDIETVSGRAIFDKAKAGPTQELTITAQALRMAIPAIEIEAEARLIRAIRAAPPSVAGDGLRTAAEEIVRLGNQPGMDDDEWEAAMAKLEAALSEPGLYWRMDRIGEALDYLDASLDDSHPEGHECDVCRAADELREAIYG